MNKWLASSSLALIASASASIWLWTELRDERARNAELAARLQQVSNSTRRGAVEASQVAASTPTAPAIEPAVPTLVTGAGTESRDSQGSRADWDAHQKRLLSDPKFREARRIQERLALAPRRANLIRLLGLTPAQADAVIDLQIEKDARWSEIYRTEVATDEARMERRSRLEALDRTYQDDLRGVLGEDKGAQLQSYMESRQTRMQIDRLRAELTEASALRDDQVEPLIAALHAERAQMQTDLQEYSDTLPWEGDQADSLRRYSDRQAELWKSMNGRMHASASSILTGTQLDALDNLLKRDYARFEAQQRVNRLQSKLDSPTSTPSR